MSSWTKVLLVVSLALNFLVGAAAISFFVRGGPHDRFTAPAYTQLVPRSFFAELSRDRRKELLSELRKYRDEFSGNRESFRQAARKLADALSAEPYDPAALQSFKAEFEDSAKGLAGKGAAVAVDLIGKLTPDERKLLATKLRERALSVKR